MSYVEGSGFERVDLLLGAALALSERREVGDVLNQIAAAASQVVDAEYTALAIYDDRGMIQTFVHHGMPDETVAALGHPPVGRGLLGELLVSAGPIRLDDLTTHPLFTGFPPGHPPMRSFLGTPVATSRRGYGNLYATEKRGGRAFDEVDERLLGALAAFAATAVENALLRVGERVRAEAELELAAARERQAHQSQLLHEVIAAQEAERARVSRDLHDDVGQALTSVLLALRLVEDALGAEPTRVGDARERTAEARALVADALQVVRVLAFELRPTVLDDLGLAAALRRLAEVTARRHGFPVEVELAGIDESVRLPAATETVVYRIVQEALTNVARHAAPGFASVFVALDGGTVRAVVEDDGRGFDPGEVGGSLGLRGMAERAALAGGTVTVDSTIGAGTTVRLEVPRG